VLERYLADGAVPGTYICLDVEDTGTGMDADTVARIFDPFFTTKFKGRGLGMAAVLGIVRTHQGGIAIDSLKGKGTKVSVLWPVQRTESSVKPPATTTPGTRATILVVDDDDGVRGLIRRVLTSNGYDVREARDGAAGLRLFEQHGATISLVVMDVTMPGMSGFEAVQQLRKAGSQVPVLMSSGYEVDRAALASLDVGGVLAKPYDVPALLKAVAEAISVRAHA
jgi:CheY-like chemotaxis protein